MRHIDPSTPRPEWLAHKSSRDLAADLQGGTEAMRQAGERWLPAYSAEPSVVYQKRLRMSVLDPQYQRFSSLFVSELLKQAPTIEDANPRLEEILPDIDRAGTPFSAWARRLVSCAVHEGMCWVLTDQDRFTEDRAPTLRDELAQRPFARIVPYSMTPNWQTGSIGGKNVLTRLSIVEISNEPDPDIPFQFVAVTRCRVLEAVPEGMLVTVWRLERSGHWEIESETLADYPAAERGLPVTALLFRDLGGFTPQPLFSEIAWINQLLWSDASDQWNLLRQSKVPILTLEAADNAENPDRQITIGGGSLVTINSGDKLAYVEPKGTALEAGRTGLQDLKDAMSQAASRVLLNQQVSSLTATSHAIASSEADSDLQAMAAVTRDALQSIIDQLGFWMGVDEPGTVQVFDDFQLTPDAEQSKLIVSMAAGGLISRQTAWRELRRRNLLDPAAFDEEAELIRLESQLEGEMSGIARSLANEDE